MKQALDCLCTVVTSYTADGRPLGTSCLAEVAECDLYIGIVGRRYGFIPPGEAVSITQLDYEEARARRMEMLSCS